jgi:hypothetical protein
MSAYESIIKTFNTLINKMNEKKMVAYIMTQIYYNECDRYDVIKECFHYPEVAYLLPHIIPVCKADKVMQLCPLDVPTSTLILLGDIVDTQYELQDRMVNMVTLLSEHNDRNEVMQANLDYLMTKSEKTINQLA